MRQLGTARVFIIGCCAMIALAAASGAPPPKKAAVHPSAHRNSLGEAYASTLWPKVNGVATVYYQVSSASDTNATSKITTAVNTFNADFPGVIQWVAWNPMAPQSPNYVSIDLNANDTSGVCEALEGYEAKPMQAMGGSTSCTVGTILHEMGHIIGLWHEQARPDAASYVTVTFANAIKGSWSYFQPPIDNYQALSYYDYASLMQYEAFAFSANGKPVIETIPAGIPLAQTEGVPVPKNIDYSAGDKETIERLYGAAPTGVTITSNPAGLVVEVDGSPVTTPMTFAWALNSTHTLAAATGLQTLTGDIANSTTSTTFYYKFGRWSNTTGTGASESITIKPGNGHISYPASAPASSVYSANFVQYVPFAAAISPAGAGQVAASPVPSTIGSSTYYRARKQIELTATGTNSYNFYEYQNSPYFLPGGVGENPKSLYVPDTGLPMATTVQFSNTPVYTVGISDSYSTSNLGIFVDGAFWYAPKNFSPSYDSTWTPNSQHTLAFDSPVYPWSSNTRFVFTAWNAPVANSTGDARTAQQRWFGGMRSSAFGANRGRVLAPRRTVFAPQNATRNGQHRMLANTEYTETITLPGSGGATYGPNVQRQFAPATNFNYPPCGGTGTLTPASPTGDGFYPSGHTLTYAATPANGWTFAGWTYDLTGTSTPASLTPTGETLVFANFNIAGTPLTVASVNPVSTSSGSAGFTLTIAGTGFAAGSLVTFNGNYRKVTYVSSTELQVAILASDVTTAGNYQVAVENFPSGSTGCAVFGYIPFFVKQ